jgi:ElaB/YqjD/DUF883 family membrane-anchored ribosome-binding protein
MEEEDKPMAEPVRNDEPLSNTRWPESPSSTAPPSHVAVPTAADRVALLPEDTPSRPLGEWPYTDRTEAATPSRDKRLEDAGEAVGEVIGTVIHEAKELPGKIQDRVSDLRRRFRVIYGRGSRDLKQRAYELGDRASELGVEAEERLSELSREARREARHWEFRARVYANRYPLKFIAGAATASFAVGFLLRLWRDEW